MSDDSSRMISIKLYPVVIGGEYAMGSEAVFSRPCGPVRFEAASSRMMRVQWLRVYVRPIIVDWWPHPDDMQVLEVIADRIEELGMPRARWFSSRIAMAGAIRKCMLHTLLDHITQPQIAQLISSMRNPPVPPNQRWEPLHADVRTQAFRSLHLTGLRRGNPMEGAFANSMNCKVGDMATEADDDTKIQLPMTFVAQTGFHVAVEFSDRADVHDVPALAPTLPSYEMRASLLGTLIL
jgi:hypothetical protein